ncbi:MAG TPA: DNA polymerase III subunit chi [Acidobacteriota bacterium]|nr:DNA polymerase III subunit chi [Acidobacteriota bacterium]
MKACIFHDLNPGQRDRKLFDIVEHAYNQHAQTVIYAPNEARAAVIDRFLWILRQESFIPHKIFLKKDPDLSVPVAIVTSEINPVGGSILVADGHCSLEFAAGFEMIHEFVDRSSAEIQEACRERFRAYRDRKIPVEHLKE